jgi:outer membrane lipoprotein carrier protein
MKKAFLILLLVFLQNGLLLAQAKPATRNDPEAKKILDAVSAKFKSFATVQAAFTYKVENAAGKVLSAKTGSITMKGTKYRLNFSGQEIICNGVTVWNIDKSANEVTINTLDASSGMITPQKLFSNFYDKDFLYVLNGEKKAGSKLVQEIQLTPVDKSKNFHTVFLQIDKLSKTMYSTRVLENAGNRYSYTVNSLKTNVPAADALFAFDKSKYPGINIEDLR